MSKIEYIDPNNWSLHVIDGEDECVPEGWILVPEDAEVYSEFADRKIFLKFNEEIVFGYIKDVFEILPIWSKKEIVVDRKSRILWSRKMKEYLVERDGKYELVEAYHLDGGIEVPENAVALIKQIGVWEGFIDDMKHKGSAKILWQRNPLLSDQCEIKTANGYGLDKIGSYTYGTRRRFKNESDSSYRNYLMNFGKPKLLLNDQCAEIEEMRQVELKDVRARADIFCKETSKHRHYFKNVQNLNMIDIYRVLELFDVQSHAVGHAVKKLLCSGGRGSKGYLQDIQEAIDSLQREIEMKKEDSK